MSFSHYHIHWKFFAFLLSILSKAKTHCTSPSEAGVRGHRKHERERARWWIEQMASRTDMLYCPTWLLVRICTGCPSTVTPLRVTLRLQWHLRQIQTEHLLQGVPRLVLPLQLLISRSYVNITEYPFNHIIIDVREFFWGTKHNGTWEDALRKMQNEFGWFSVFCGFSPILKTPSPFWPLLTSCKTTKWRIWFQ